MISHTLLFPFDLSVQFQYFIWLTCLLSSLVPFILPSMQKPRTFLWRNHPEPSLRITTESNSNFPLFNKSQLVLLLCVSETIKELLKQGEMRKKPCISRGTVREKGSACHTRLQTRNGPAVIWGFCHRCDKNPVRGAEAQQYGVIVQPPLKHEL